MDRKGQYHLSLLTFFFMCQIIFKGVQGSMNNFSMMSLK